MSCLALYLMICSCGTSHSQHLAEKVRLINPGCVMRAAKNEIFGEAPEDRPSSSGGAAPDLTSSRLQSELYLSAAYQALRLCSFLSNPTMYTIQAQASPLSFVTIIRIWRPCCAEADPSVVDQCVLVRQREGIRQLGIERFFGPTMYFPRSPRRSTPARRQRVYA